MHTGTLILFAVVLAVVVLMRVRRRANSYSTVDTYAPHEADEWADDFQTEDDGTSAIAMEEW